ncbi:MAG: hypothetical protein NTY98_03245 [Verrucomicrobia bacterium]|nr:hypothetical protein [Verrucomicrobiota bacterium]
MKTQQLTLLLPLLVLASCVTPPPPGERVVGRRPVTPRQVSDSIAQQWEGFLQDSPFSSASGNMSFIDSASQIGGTASRVSSRASTMQDARLSAHAQRVASWCQETLQTKQQLDSQISSIKSGGELRDHFASKAGGWALDNSEGTNHLGRFFGGFLGGALSQAYTNSEVSGARRAATMRVTREALDLIEEEDALGREIGIAPTPGLERTLGAVMDMRKTLLFIGSWKGEYYPAIKGTTTHSWQFWGDGDFTCRMPGQSQSGKWSIQNGRMTFRWHNGITDIMIPEFTSEGQVTLRPTRNMKFPTMVKFSDDPSQTPPLPAPGPPLNIRINM